MAARKVVRRTGRNSFRGYYQSKKMARSVEWESIVEMDAIYHFEFCSRIKSFREQPEKIEFWFEGKYLVYFPDFELVMNDGEVIHVEIKPKTKLSDPKLKKRLQLIQEHYLTKGIRFIVITDEDIRNQSVLANLKLLAYHNRWASEDQELQTARDALAIHSAMTMDAAKAVLGSEQDVYRLLAAKAYVCDLTQPIEGSTTIYRATEENRYVAFHI